MTGGLGSKRLEVVCFFVPSLCIGGTGLFDSVRQGPQRDKGVVRAHKMQQVRVSRPPPVSQATITLWSDRHQLGSPSIARRRSAPLFVLLASGHGITKRRKNMSYHRYTAVDKWVGQRHQRVLC